MAGGERHVSRLYAFFGLSEINANSSAALPSPNEWNDEVIATQR